MTIRREDLNTTNLFQIEDKNLKTLEIQLSGKIRQNVFEKSLFEVVLRRITTATISENYSRQKT